MNNFALKKINARFYFNPEEVRLQKNTNKKEPNNN